MNLLARLAPWLLPALVALAYLPSLGAPFQFDDYKVIVDNPAVHSLGAWWQSMPGIRPLLKLTYALNWAMGTGPAGFRALNIVLHAANALLVWLILSELASRRSLSRAVPLLAAALFALHPVQTEAVTYICGRSVSLMAFFYLLSVQAWLLAERRDSRTLKLLSCAAFAAAFLVKETAIILPAALWLASRMAAQRAPLPVALPAKQFGLAAMLAALEPAALLAAAQATLRAYRWPLSIAAAAALLLLALPAYRTFLAVGLAQRSPMENLALQVDSVFYLGSHLLQPALMNIDPALPTTVDWGVPLAARAGLLALAIALAVWAFRRRSFTSFCVLWFFLHLAPTNSLLARVDIANDRQLYLSSIGAFALFAHLAWQAALWLRTQVSVPRKAAVRWPLVLGAVLVSALVTWAGVQTVARNRVYRDEIAFWQDVAAKSPQSARAFNNLGYAYHLAGRVDEARAAYLQALAIAPSMPQPRWNLEALSPAGATAAPSPAPPSSAR